MRTAKILVVAAVVARLATAERNCFHYSMDTVVAAVAVEVESSNSNKKTKKKKFVNNEKKHKQECAKCIQKCLAAEAAQMNSCCPEQAACLMAYLCQEFAAVDSTSVAEWVVVALPVKYHSNT